MTVVNGTAASDAFTVASGSGNVTIAGRATVARTGTSTDLFLNGYDGDDTFAIAGTLPYATVTVDGGNPSASDVVNLSGATGAVVIDLAAQAVTGYGGTVSLLGVEVLNASTGGNSITVTGTGNPDAITATPTGTNTATIVVAGLNLTINTTNTSTLLIDAAAGNDTVTVQGTSGSDTIAVVRGATTTVTVGLEAGEPAGGQHRGLGGGVGPGR